MRLERVRVQNFKSVTDSGWVNVGDVVCLVGKNEAGKTALLEALRHLNPPEPESGDFELMDFPRKSLAKYQRTHGDSPAEVLTAELMLSSEELDEIAETFGPDFITDDNVIVNKGYANKLTWRLKMDEAAALNHVRTLWNLRDEVTTAIGKAKTLDAIKEILAAQPADDEESAEMHAYIDEQFPRGFKAAIPQVLSHMLPVCTYFSDYSILPGRVSVDELIRRQTTDSLEDSDLTVLGLLALGGTSPSDFQDEHNFESQTAMLEAASNNITDEVFKYWSQNKDLEVQVAVAPADPEDSPPLNSGSILHFSIRNTQERWSVPFEHRSRGFVWFFSFLAYFSQFDQTPNGSLLLLDEPGLSLHASAQNDFLRFIYDRLATTSQVMYTTHSPFMIDANKLEDSRLVFCREKKGTTVVEDVLKTDSDTVFPLQAALGYTLSQSLFVGPNSLLVEGPSDMIYLQLLSAACARSERTALSDQWVIIPTGGADKLAYFVSLMGRNKINLAVLLDSAWDSPQRVSNLLSQKLIAKRQIVSMAEIVGAKEADIEDLFESGLYLRAVNAAYKTDLAGTNLTVAQLDKKIPRLTKRVELAMQMHMGPDFILNHYRPAAQLQRDQAKASMAFSDTTLVTASGLFDRLNALLV